MTVQISRGGAGFCSHTSLIKSGVWLCNLNICGDAAELMVLKRVYDRDAVALLMALLVSRLQSP